MKTQWVRITHRDNIPLREGRSVRIGGRDIAIFNLGDRFLAVENRCPHRGGPLSEGIVSGKTVVCPLHSWKISLECGAVIKPADANKCVQTFQTRVDAGVILLEVPAAEAIDISPAVSELSIFESTFTQSEA
jgi:nitrite reductase (NADH) small subunit